MQLLLLMLAISLFYQFVMTLVYGIAIMAMRRELNKMREELWKTREEIQSMGYFGDDFSIHA